MSEHENVLARWSRLKREASQKEAAAPEAPVAPHKSDQPAATGPKTDSAALAVRPPPRTFDPESLPPIDSITATSDISAFLEAGVPEELTRAALRRVWAADPEIRDFIGLAENQWDFTDPLGVPGFGSLDASTDIRDLVAQATGQIREVTEPLVEEPAPVGPAGPPAAVADQPAGMPEGNPTSAENSGSADEAAGVVAAMQYEQTPGDLGPAPNRRVHGRAMPQ